MRILFAFGSGITTDSIDVRQDGDDLLIAVLGNDGTWPDMLVLEDWFMNTDSQVSGFTFADGRTAALSAAEMTALAGCEVGSLEGRIFGYLFDRDRRQ